MSKDVNQFADDSGEFLNSDSDVPGDTHLNEPLNEDGEGANAHILQELDEQKDKYLRLVAEFDNFRKRTAKERMEYMASAGKDVIISLLDVLDDMDRAEKIHQENGEPLDEGVLLVFNKFRNILAQKGLKAMNCVGQPFDPDREEAISQIPAGDKHRGKIIEEVSKGYELNDNIIRFAKVVVGG